MALIGTGIADAIRSWSLPFYFISCFANAANVFFFLILIFRIDIAIVSSICDIDMANILPPLLISNIC